jgi:hypothetical protein
VKVTTRDSCYARQMSTINLYILSICCRSDWTARGVRSEALTEVVATPSQNRAIFESDGVVDTTRDSRNAAGSINRNEVVVVPAPSNYAAIFQSNTAEITTRDSRNAAIGRVRNGALTLVVATPSQNRAIFQSDGVSMTCCNSGNPRFRSIRDN